MRSPIIPSTKVRDAGTRGAFVASASGDASRGSSARRAATFESMLDLLVACECSLPMLTEIM